jgi:hypothetical protein
MKHNTVFRCFCGEAVEENEENWTDWVTNLLSLSEGCELNDTTNGDGTGLFSHMLSIETLCYKVKNVMVLTIRER